MWTIIFLLVILIGYAIIKGRSISDTSAPDFLDSNTVIELLEKHDKTIRNLGDEPLAIREEREKLHNVLNFPERWWIFIADISALSYEEKIECCKNFGLSLNDFSNSQCKGFFEMHDVSNDEEVEELQEKQILEFIIENESTFFFVLLDIDAFLKMKDENTVSIYIFRNDKKIVYQADVRDLHADLQAFKPGPWVLPVMQKMFEVGQWRKTRETQTAQDTESENIAASRKNFMDEVTKD